MFLAKLALGFGGVIALAGAYTFHEGVMRIDEDGHDGRHVHLWIPAAILPLAVHVIPSHEFDHASADAAAWMPTLRVLTKELKRYPESELVNVEDSSQRVRIRTHQGKLLIDVIAPGETVHVSCPLATMEDIAGILEAKSPRV